jgi:hypothetical protein
VDMHQLKRVEEILETIKPLAGEYYRLTGKPLGVTGEVAEYVVAQTLGLKLAPAREAGYDAIRITPNGAERIQIKGRAFGETSKRSQRLGRIKSGAACDKIILVLLDNSTLEPVEMHEAVYHRVVEHLTAPGSKARNERGAMSVSAFKRLATPIWPSKC